MSKPINHWLAIGVVLALSAAGTIAAPGGANNPAPGPSATVSKADAKLIARLALDDPRQVENALEDLEVQTHPSTNALLAARKLLADPRPTVRQKAARVLGTLHAEVDQDDLKAICFMLKSHDVREADNALKSLRGLNAGATVQEITPLLKSSQNVLVRDACRTLAVLGGKDLIPTLEPLLKHPDSEVKKDAQAAIEALRAKP